MPRRPKRTSIVSWVAILALGLGSAALLLVGTIWSVPMALLANDPRLVGLVLIGVGLGLAVSSLRLLSVEKPRPKRAFYLIGLGIVSVSVTATVYLTSPYILEQIRFQSDGVELAGTLLVPKGEAPNPGIVFLHGSGPETRAVSFHTASRFASAGVTALIFDKRGTGESVGGSPWDSYADLAGDGVAAIRFLADHSSVDRDHVGLWGLSEGGWTAPLAASMNPGGVAFLVVVSGAGASTEDEELYSIQTLLEDSDIEGRGIESALTLRRSINEYYRTGEGLEELQAEVQGVQETEWFRAAGFHLPRADEIYVYGSAEWKSHLMFLDFDAVPILSQLDTPMLFIHGEMDRSYPAALSVRRLQELSDTTGGDITIVGYPDADHSIMTRRIPWPQFPEGYYERMISWVLERVGPLE